MLSTLNKQANFSTFVTIYFITFAIRAAVFMLYIQPYGYYKQSDSLDYHYSATSVALGKGMYKPNSNQPIFWRTPGYPTYLSYFYSFFGINSLELEKNQTPINASIWVQIILSSFIPIMLFFLAFLLTSSYPIAWLTSLISVFHIGLVLAPAYLLTEGLALIFFYLFLFFFYQQFFGTSKKWVLPIIYAVASLSIYTWIRPMGEFIGIFSTLFLLFLGKEKWKINVKKSILFFCLFFGSLMPWYIRNYQLTGHWFFCPTLGVYLNVFSAPKIVSRVQNIPLEQAWKATTHAADIETYKAYKALQGTGKYVSPTLAKKISYPICLAYPCYFCLDWLQESIKTALDLYSYQLTAMIANTFYWDPLQEFLTEKIAACLWTQPMPLAIRALCWLELLWSIFLWVGLLSGLYLFLLRPLWKKITTYERDMRWLWLNTGLMIGLAICMTGGFGYARLRLPVEPLMIILSLTFWMHCYSARRKTN